jgi:hypothetical protein
MDSVKVKTELIYLRGTNMRKILCMCWYLLGYQQALYHLNHTHNPFCFSVFPYKISCFYLTGFGP